MLSSPDQALLKEYADLSGQLAGAGQIVGWLGTLERVGAAAGNQGLFAGDSNAQRTMVEALTSFESQTAISDPFVGMNATWRPSNFIADEKAVADGLIAHRISKFDRDILARFFTVLDNSIEQTGPAADHGAIHAQLRNEDAAQVGFSLLDPYHDARITRYPDARGSRPGSELYLAGRRDGTLPNVRIGSRDVDYMFAVSHGMDLDLGRIEASELMSGGAKSGWDKTSIRPTMMRAGSHQEFREICDRYTTAANAQADQGYSLWFRGQSKPFSFADALSLSPIGWQATRRRISKRLTHLEDDDLLIASVFRGFGERWKSSESIAAMFASIGAWQLVANDLLQDTEIFPVAPEVEFTSTLAPEARKALQQWRSDPFSFKGRTLLKFAAGADDRPPVVEHYLVIDGVEHLLFARRHQLDRANASGGLVLQHYGCPTGGLDISLDPDVALAFAAGGVGTEENGRFVRRPRGASTPVVYLLLLREGRDPFLRSQAMFNGASYPNRIDLQKCGILFGSSSYCRNYAYRHVVARIELNFELPEFLDPEAVYPSRSEDRISDYICRRFPEAYAVAKDRLAAGGAGARAPDTPLFTPTYRD